MKLLFNDKDTYRVRELFITSIMINDNLAKKNFFVYVAINQLVAVIMSFTVIRQKTFSESGRHMLSPSLLCSSLSRNIVRKKSLSVKHSMC